MDGDRELCLLGDIDQWARCGHENTALLTGGGVQLTWDDDAPIASAVRPSGLAFDRWGRAYRSYPEEGRVSVHLAGRDGSTCAGSLDCPRGLDVDATQHLYIAESRHVAVMDLWSRRLLRRIPMRQGPIDVAADRDRAYVLAGRGVAVVRGRRGPIPGPGLTRPRCHGSAEPHRLAVTPDGTLLVLWRRVEDSLGIVTTVDGGVLVEVPGATDLDVGRDGMLVVATGRISRAEGYGSAELDGPFRRFMPYGTAWLELEPVAATGYDGGAIAIGPDGAVCFTTEEGIGWTGGSAARHRPAGRLVTYRLDSGAYRTRWGRVFLDACIPPGADVRARFLTSDDDEVTDPIMWRLAQRGGGVVRRPDRTPPLPSGAALAALPAPFPLFRRTTGPESAWAEREEGTETYETAVRAEPGRYLWVVLELSGTSAATPRIRALRVERPGHRLLDHLPRSWSRDEGDADFLQRFLAPAEGMIHELDARATRRELLVDPVVTPGELLGWLAGFAGLVLDERWPEHARRTLVAEAYPLFRRRGTRWSLQRMLEIYLGCSTAIIERWQLRGVPGAVLGDEQGAPPVVGGMRVGGSLGRDGYQTAAHRFTVLIPADLTSEQLDVVRSILDAERPAHTTYEICELGLGMRVGRHLHLGLTAIVGPGAAWGPAILGQVAVGGDGVVGTPSTGARLGSSSIVGAVRVG